MLQSHKPIHPKDEVINNKEFSRNNPSTVRSEIMRLIYTVATILPFYLFRFFINIPFVVLNTDSKDSFLSITYPSCNNNGISILGFSSNSAIIAAMLIQLILFLYPSLTEYLVNNQAIASFVIRKVNLVLGLFINVISTVLFFLFIPIKIDAKDCYINVIKVLLFILFQLSFLFFSTLKDIISRYTLSDPFMLLSFVEGTVELRRGNIIYLYAFSLFIFIKLLIHLSDRKCKLFIPNFEYAFCNHFLPKPIMTMRLIHIFDVDSPYFVFEFVAKNTSQVLKQNVINDWNTISFYGQFILVLILITILSTLYYALIVAFSGIIATVKLLERQSVTLFDGDEPDFSDYLKSTVKNFTLYASIVNSTIFVLLQITQSILLPDLLGDKIAITSIFQALLYFHYLEVIILQLRDSIAYMHLL